MDDIWSSKSIARDLSKYVDVVKKHELFFSVDKLLTLADEMTDIAYCSITDIELDFFNYKPISKTVPKISHFKVSLINSLVSKPDIDLTIMDPIDICVFDIILTGYCAIEGDKQYRMACHLDKDIVQAGDGSHKYTHPLYHFQYGGNHIEEQDTGSIMLMGAPRLPHPPMDIFLSIHFILNNYFNKEEDDFSCLKDLFADDDYIDILERAKERMWYPFFKGLNDRDNTHPELNMASLFPLAAS